MKQTGKRLTAILLALTCGLSLIGCAGQDGNSNTESSDIAASQEQELQDMKNSLSDVISNSGFKGITFVSRNDETLLLKSTGFSDEERTEQLDENTAFCLADNTKQFTAAAVMWMLHREKVSIADKLSKFFPDCAYGDRVSIHQLMCMRSGIPDYLTTTDKNGTHSLLPSDQLPVSVSEKAGAEKNKKAIQDYILSRELSFRPGTKAEYSNSNYFLLARIIEIVSGKTFEEYVQQYVFDPLEMKQTGFTETYDGTLACTVMKDTGQEYVYYPGVGFGSMNLVSTLHDLRLWAASFRTYLVLTKDDIADMVYNNSDKSDAFSYGYGLMLDQYEEAFFHTGTAASFASMLYVRKTENTCFILLTNHPDTNIELVGTRLANVLFPGAETLDEE